MGFVSAKKSALNNLAQSYREKDADEGVRGLLEAINSHDCMYTTSSCAGRTVLMADLGGKGVNYFREKWHSQVGVDEVLDCLDVSDGVLWLRYESPILHVICREIGCATKMLYSVRECGFKRSGIQSIKDERILVEVLSTERVDAPIMRDAKVLVDESYVGELVKECNSRHLRALAKIDKLLTLASESICEHEN